MANGKPGDHPITDILLHNIIVFSPAIDNLIREISKLVPEYKLYEMFNWFSPPALREFEKELKKILAKLKNEARERGWEVD